MTLRTATFESTSTLDWWNKQSLWDALNSFITFTVAQLHEILLYGASSERHTMYSGPSMAHLLCLQSVSLIPPSLSTRHDGRYWRNRAENGTATDGEHILPWMLRAPQTSSRCRATYGQQLERTLQRPSSLFVKCSWTPGRSEEYSLCFSTRCLSSPTRMWRSLPKASISFRLWCIRINGKNVWSVWISNWEIRTRPRPPTESCKQLARLDFIHAALYIFLLHHCLKRASNHVMLALGGTDHWNRRPPFLVWE